MMPVILKALFALFLIVTLSHPSLAATPPHTHYTAIIIDSAHSVPLQLARVSLYRSTTFIAGKISSILGRAEFTDVDEGTYELHVSIVGYRSISRTISITSEHTIDTIWMQNIEQEEITVAETAMATIPSIDVETGAQTLDAANYHASPTHRIINLVQENLLGAVRAPTGEVHVKGMHGEYTYYVDGIPVPLGVFGGLNEVVDDKVVDIATLTSGTIDAQYGGQTAAIIELQNRVPSGNAHLTASMYGGSYLGRDNAAPDSIGITTAKLKPINQNGQSLSLSDHIGDLGVFLSGSRQETDRRIDEPVNLIDHDHGFDYFTYGKLDYLFGENDYATVNFNWSKTNTQIPFDPIEEGTKEDRQMTANSYQSFSYYHTFSREADNGSDLFIGLFRREGSLLFTPGSVDAHDFYFLDDPQGYILAEDRSFNTYGFRTKFTKQYSHEVQFIAGMDLSTVNGTEHFIAYDTTGSLGHDLSSTYSGSNFGAFIQSNIHPLEWTSIDLGIRYDQQIAPNKPLEKQLEPRIKWNFHLDEASNAYVYYGKQMVPNNIEGLRLVASVSDSATVPTLAERDDYYEAGVIHSFDFGLRFKGDCFKRISLPGVDDQTIGSSAIKTPVNLGKVTTTGVELALSFSSPSTFWSGYINTSLIHAYGSGLITGGFLPIDDAGTASDLDHDQRLSVVTSIKYQPEHWYANLTAIYGSGLTNGNEGYEFKTSLLDFNQGAHTTPSWIVNLSGGYTFRLSGGTEIEPSLYINNLFDHNHLLKGAFFSGAAWEDPRNVVLKLEVRV
jgi:hypothetical protein